MRGTVNVAGGGGSSFDLANYTLFQKDPMDFVPASAGNYETIVNITGEGFLQSACCMMYNSYNYCGIKITIDGTVIWQSYGTKTPLGLVPMQMITGGYNYYMYCQQICYTYPGSEYQLVPNYIENIPYVSSTGRAWCPIAVPLNFTTSCKVELYVSSSASGYCRFCIAGGYK